MSDNSDYRTTGISLHINDSNCRIGSSSDLTINICEFLNPLKHNWINLVNLPSYYLVQIPDLGYHNQAIISCKAVEI